MNDKPLVSVMVPTYNQDKYIEKTINSILEQTYNNIEIIISDDSTNNLTEELIKEKYLNKKYKNIVYIHNKPSKGEVDNYRYLLYKLIKGEWVLNVNGDDFLYDNKFIEIAMQYITKNPDIVLVTSKNLKYYMLDNKFVKIDNIPHHNLITKGEWLFFNHIFKNVEIPHIGTLFNRKKAIEVGFYEYNIPSSDRESFLKLSLSGDIVYLNDYYGAWVQHNENHSKNIDKAELIETLKMYDRLYKYAIQYKLSKFKLLLWRILAKYKMIFSYYQTTDDKQSFLKELTKNHKIYVLILIIDIRNYFGKK